MSYNQLEKLNGIETLVKLKVVRAGNNKISQWDGLKALVRCPSRDQLLDLGVFNYNFPFCLLRLRKASLPLLEDVTLIGNPLEESYASKQTWRDELATKFPTLKKVEGKMIIRDENGKPIRGKDEELASVAEQPSEQAKEVETPKEGGKGKGGKGKEKASPSGKGSRVGTRKGK